MKVLIKLKRGLAAIQAKIIGTIIVALNSLKNLTTYNISNTFGAKYIAKEIKLKK